MREYTEIPTQIIKHVPESVSCDKCGKTKKLSGDEWDRLEQSNDYQTIEIEFGYGSKFDMDIWKFDICEECLEEFVNTFKQKPSGYGEEE